MWDQNRYALEFFSLYEVPFWNMTNANNRLADDNWCLAEPNDDFLVVFLHKGGTDAIDLFETNYLVQWYDPRNGGALQLGTVQVLPPKPAQFIGQAPDSRDRDWVVLLQRCTNCSPDGGGGTKIGLIIGLVFAGLLVAIAAYVVFASRYKAKKTVEQTPDPTISVDEVPPRRDPPSGPSAPMVSTEPSYCHAEVLGEASPPSKHVLPGFKDQVRDFEPNGDTSLPMAAPVATGETRVELENSANNSVELESSFVVGELAEL